MDISKIGSLNISPDTAEAIGNLDQSFEEVVGSGEELADASATELLTLMQEMQTEARVFETFTQVEKTKHDAMMGAIRKISQ